MNYTQNEKIMQITDNTLIVGLDVGSMTQHARAFDFRGIELAKLIKFQNNAEGFEEFRNWVDEIKKRYSKNTVMVGMEPTGHYWFTLAHFLKDNNIDIVLVNPFHVKRSKEFDDNNPTKNDRKDPKTIAMLVKDGRYMIPYIPEGIYSELRNVMDTKWRITKQLNSIKNRVERWLCIYFPEFNSVFGNWEGKAALMALREFPTPQKVLEKGVEGIVATWKTEITRAVGVKRALKLVEAAKVSVGVATGLRTAENELVLLLQEYQLLQNHYESVIAMIEELAIQVPGVSQMLKIKGVGIITAAGFVAEVGDIARFDHPKQIQKLAGLNLKENSSGKHEGVTKITKRGRKRLRCLLFQCMIPLIAKNQEFKEIHKYYITRTGNPLKKRQSMILLCCKLIRIFFALMKKGIVYNPQKVLDDIKRPSLQIAT